MLRVGELHMTQAGWTRARASAPAIGLAAALVVMLTWADSAHTQNMDQIKAQCMHSVADPIVEACKANRTPREECRAKIYPLVVACMRRQATAVGLASGTMNLGKAINHRLPFHSPVLAAVALGLIVGVPMALGAATSLAGRPGAGGVAIRAGVLLMAWIVVEMALIRSFSILQPIFFLAGVSIVLVGIHVAHHGAIPERTPDRRPRVGR